MNIIEELQKEGLAYLEEAKKFGVDTAEAKEIFMQLALDPTVKPYPRNLFDQALDEIKYKFYNNIY